MMLMRNLAQWLNSLFVSAEDEFLSRSVDLADFERRQRMLESNSHRSLYNHMWY